MSPSSHDRGFSLIEVFIAGVLFAVLMLATLGVLSQAQRDMKAQTTRTVLGEASRKILDDVTRELRETSRPFVIAGGRTKTSGVGEIRNYISMTNELDVSTCPDQYCPFVFSGPSGTGSERDPNVRMSRLVRLSTANFTGVSPASGIMSPLTVLGRTWVGVAAGGACPLPHAYPSLTNGNFDVGAILFASPRDWRGRFMSNDGIDVAPDWQGLIFYVPYSVGAATMELRRYEFHIDDLIRGESALLDTKISPAQGGVTVSVTSGTGAANGAFSTNRPAGKPTLIDLLDSDGDGRIDDGVFDVITGASGADATDETFAVTGTGPSSVITYSKRGTGAGGVSIDFSITINRKSGFLTCAVNNNYGGLVTSPRYQKTITVSGRSPRTIVSRLVDIAFDTSLNCPFDATDNPTGLQSPQDSNVIRITALLDRLTSEGSLTVATDQVVTTRVQPRN